MTFDQLADKAGIGRQALLKISGGRSNGDLRTWMKLSRAFGVGLDELLAPAWQDGEGKTDES